MKTLLALILSVCFVSAPGAIAGDISTTDSDYLFSQENVEATTLSDEEMDSTKGQLNVEVDVDAGDELGAVGGLVGTLLGSVPSLPSLPL